MALNLEDVSSSHMEGYRMVPRCMDGCRGYRGCTEGINKLYRMVARCIEREM